MKDRANGGSLAWMTADREPSSQSFEADRGARISRFEPRFRAIQIMILPRRQHQAERIAQGINQHVNFGGQSSARSADGLRAVFFRAPALC